MTALEDSEDNPPLELPSIPPEPIEQFREAPNAVDTIPALSPDLEALAELVVKKLATVLGDIADKLTACDNGIRGCNNRLDGLDEALRAQGQSLAEAVVQISANRIVVTHVSQAMLELQGTVQGYHAHAIEQASLTGRRLSAIDELLTDQGGRIVDLEARRREQDGENNGSLTDAVARARNAE